MRVFGVFPFSEAITKQVGHYVAMGGKPHKVLEVVRTGRNEPYFRLEGVDRDHWLAENGLISWQVLGDVREDPVITRGNSYDDPERSDCPGF